MKKIRNITINGIKVKAIITPLTCSVFQGGVKLFEVAGRHTSICEPEKGLQWWVRDFLSGNGELGDPFSTVEVISIDDPIRAEYVVNIVGDVRKNAGLPPRYYKIIDRVPETFGNDRNGGDYAFSRKLVKTDKGWKTIYLTSSDFDYCDCCGSFNHWSDCPCGQEYRYLETLPTNAVPVW